MVQLEYQADPLDDYTIKQSSSQPFPKDGDSVHQRSDESCLMNGGMVDPLIDRKLLLDTTSKKNSMKNSA